MRNVTRNATEESTENAKTAETTKAKETMETMKTTKRKRVKIIAAAARTIFFIHEQKRHWGLFEIIANNSVFESPVFLVEARWSKFLETLLFNR